MGALRVVTSGQTLVLAAVTNASGTTVGVWTTSAHTVPVALPATVSADTTFWLNEGAVNVTLTQTDGSVLLQQVQTQIGSDGSPMVMLTAVPSAPQVYEDLSNLSGTYAPLAGPLGRSKAKLINSPATYKQAHVGDSTSDAATAAGYIYRSMMALHTQQGEALSGVGPSDYFTDGVGNNTTTFTSATAAFTSADVNRYVHGKSFPLSTTIASVTNSTTVVLNAAVPTGTALPFYVDRHILNGGNNGVLLSDWMANPGGAYPYNRNHLVTDNPDVIVYSWLINDIRTGGLGLTVDACVAAGIPLLAALIDWTRATMPGADILLRIPNTFLSANTGSLNFVTDGTNINPAGLAQIYSTALRRIYLHFVGLYPNVDVIDMQAEVFGTRSVASSPLMANQLHPSVNVTADINLMVPRGGGYAAIGDALAKRLGVGRNAFPPNGAERVQSEFIVYDAPSANQVRLISRDAYGLPAPQCPVFNGDLLYINGVDSPITLGSTAVDRTVSSTVLLLTGLTGDFSPYIGNTAMVAGSHASETTGDRQQIFIDLPSIAAGATVTQSVTVTGALPGNQGKGTAVIASPGATFTASALLLIGCFPSGTDTVRLVIQNPSGGALDMAGESWTFWVVR